MSSRIKMQAMEIRHLELPEEESLGLETSQMGDRTIRVLIQGSSETIPRTPQISTNDKVSAEWEQLLDPIRSAAQSLSEGQYFSRKTVSYLIGFFRDKELAAIQKLGAGKFGSVYRLLFRDNSSVALKIQDALIDSEGLKKYQVFNPLRGDCVSSRLAPELETSPDAIVYCGATNAQIAMVMPFIEGKDLGEILKDRFLSGLNPLEICLQIAEILKVLHEKSIEHRDLKPRNIMVRTDGAVALIDFGIAKSYQTGDEPESPVGTDPYKAPERESRTRLEGPIGQADIWSLGIVLSELLLGKGRFPFKAYEFVLMAQEKRRNISSCLKQEALESIRCPEVKELMIEMLDLQKRPSADEVISRLQEILRAPSPYSTASRFTIETEGSIGTKPSSDALENEI